MTAAKIWNRVGMLTRSKQSKCPGRGRLADSQEGFSARSNLGRYCSSELATSISLHPNDRATFVDKLEPAFLRLSAMISQYFTRSGFCLFALYTAMTKSNPR